MAIGKEQLPNQHFRKKWQFNVKTWFNQPARKVRRRNARALKAKRLFPRPAAGPLRPVVHGQTIKYNFKKRLGRGFSLAELKEAGLPVKYARSIGVSVDHRRRNRSLESLQENVQRLKAYKSNLVLFPRNSKKPKAGDASAEELQTVQQVSGTIMPIQHTKHELKYVPVTEAMKSFSAYGKLRLERTNAKLEGLRKKRAADEKAKEESK